MQTSLWRVQLLGSIMIYDSETLMVISNFNTLLKMIKIIYT